MRRKTCTHTTHKRQAIAIVYGTDSSLTVLRNREEGVAAIAPVSLG